MQAVRHFYYDVAPSTTPTALHGLLELTTPDDVLFGSDFPYAP
jgi:predicted TIM-barrel fold metal-dependent hydrolase